MTRTQFLFRWGNRSVVFYYENGELKTTSWIDSRIELTFENWNRNLICLFVLFIRHAIQSSHRSSFGCDFRDLCQFDVDRFAFGCPKWRHTLWIIQRESGWCLRMSNDLWKTKKSHEQQRKKKHRKKRIEHPTEWRGSITKRGYCMLFDKNRFMCL